MHKDVISNKTYAQDMPTNHLKYSSERRSQRGKKESSQLTSIENKNSMTYQGFRSIKPVIHSLIPEPCQLAFRKISAKLVNFKLRQED